MSEPKRRIQVQLHGNQNYLNFIKKNHLSIQDQFNGYSSPKSPHLQAQYQGNGSGNFSFKRNSYDRQDIAKEKPITSRVIHDSLSKFQCGPKQLNHVSEVYSYEKGNALYSASHSSIYDTVEKKNNQIASQLLLVNKTKHAKHEAAKELLFHLNNNRLPDRKKHQFKGIKLDRYQSIQEQPQVNLKFPIIQKKQLTTISAEETSVHATQKNLRDRVKIIERRERQKTVQRKQSTESEKQLSISCSKDVQQPTRVDKIRELENKFKIREELYGLLPSFKGSQVHRDVLKKQQNPAFKHRLKLQKANSSPPREAIQEYLEKNILCSSISIKNGYHRESNAVINRDVIDATMFDNKQESQIFELTPKSRPSSQIQPKTRLEPQQIISKEVQIKHKPKKQAISEIRYDGDLSVYDLKIRYYRQFIFMINLAHRIFDPILLKDFNSIKPDNKYRFYLGKGNNYLLVKSLLKRRYWWVAQEDPKKANFVWTQLKVNYFYQMQQKAQPLCKHHKQDKDFGLPSPKKKKKRIAADVKQPIKAGSYKAPLPPNDRKIFTTADKQYYDSFLEKAGKPEKLLNFSNRIKYFEDNFFKQREAPANEKVHNHFQFNYFIGNKKALFYNLKQYYSLLKKDVFSVIPLTFHIKQGTTDPNFQQFIRQYKKIVRQKSKKNPVKNVWIVKPGELSNRGQGITVIDEIYELNNILRKKEKHFNGQQKTYIVQKYIERPLLYKGRKFDIRHFMMISRLHGLMRAYWFGEGYIRTSSYEYNIEEVGDEMIHLTNDAIQKYSQGYGKYEEGNKVSYNEFQRYIDSTLGEGKFNFSEQIYPQMKQIALDSVKATYLQMDPTNTQHNFQIFGLDFMIDAQYNVWLIQVNTNPCLELSSKLLQRIIPTMLQQTFKLALDPIFPPPAHYPNSQKYLCPDNPLQRLQYELIFDEARDGLELEKLFQNSKNVDMGEVDEEDETYENDGNQIQLDNDLD